MNSGGLKSRHEKYEVHSLGIKITDTIYQWMYY